MQGYVALVFRIPPPLAEQLAQALPHGAAAMPTQVNALLHEEECGKVDACLVVTEQTGRQRVRWHTRVWGIQPGLRCFTRSDDVPAPWTGQASFDPASALRLPQPRAEAGQPAPLGSARFERRAWAMQWKGRTVEVTCEAGELLLARHTRTFAECRISTRVTDASTDDLAAAAAADALFDYARYLQDKVALFTVHRSWLEDAACGDAGPNGLPVPEKAAAIRYARNCPPAEAFAAVLRATARHWLANEPGVRQHAGSEYLHQMRVAIRRLRTAVRVFEPWVDSTWTGEIAPDLRWLGALLGQARDWDVFVESTLPALTDEAAQSRLALDWPRARRAALARHARAHRELDEALQSTRYARLTLDFMAWLHRLSSNQEAAHGAPDIACYAARVLKKRYKRVARAPDLASLPEQERHRVRIQAKRLRYALDFFAPLLARRTREQGVARLAGVQDALGAGNDAAVAARLVDTLRLAPPAHAFVQGWLTAHKAFAVSAAQPKIGTLKRPRLRT